MADISLTMDSRAHFEQLYRAYADRVHAYVRRRATASVADDVVADVFVVAWRRLGQVPDEPLPWLLGVARRILANRRRSDDRRLALVHRLSGAADAFAPPPEPLDDAVLRALATLREPDRELLLLIAWEGLDQAEVAQVLGLRRNTVAVRLHRARQRLADSLAAQDEHVPTPMEVRR